MANQLASIGKLIGVASLSLANFASRGPTHTSNCEQWKPNWDGFDDEPWSRGVNHFILVRNGQTHKRPWTLTDTPSLEHVAATDSLTDLGRRQASQLGVHLTKFFHGNPCLSLDRIVTSPMGGDRETAELVFGRMREGLCETRVEGKWRENYSDGFEEVEEVRK